MLHQVYSRYLSGKSSQTISHFTHLPVNGRFIDINKAYDLVDVALHVLAEYNTLDILIIFISTHSHGERSPGSEINSRLEEYNTIL